MQVTAYRAGHVLGACMFEVEIAGMRLLYTGDYSRVPDRHLSAADTPDNPPHIGEVKQACHKCIVISCGSLPRQVAYNKAGCLKLLPRHIMASRLSLISSCV